MKAIAASTAETKPPSLALPLAWAFMLAISILPDVLTRELGGTVPAWLFWARLVCTAALLAASLAQAALKPLRAFFIVFLALPLLDWFVGRGLAALGWEKLVAGTQPYINSMLLVQGPRLLLALAMCAVMWFLTRSRRKFFLVKGSLATPAAPIPWIMTRPTSWHILGPFLGVVMPLGLLVFMLVFGRPPTGQAFIQVLPLVPFVLLFAACNAFGEEVSYRLPFLTTLEGVIGPGQTLFLSAAYFGIAHYYGVPYGVLGVVMSLLVGWLMGKAILETRGLFWAWWIHFCMDVTIFIFIAMGSVTPGG